MCSNTNQTAGFNPFRAVESFGGRKKLKGEQKAAEPKEAESKEAEPVKQEPAPVAPTDTGSGQDSTGEANDKQRKKRGYAATRVANDRVVLTDSAPVSGGRQTLG